MKRFFLVVIFISLILLLISYNIVNINFDQVLTENVKYKESDMKMSKNESIKQNINAYQKYSKNREMLINNNLIQYSSYLIFDQEEQFSNRICTIEAFVFLNHNKNIKKFGGMEKFACVLKLLHDDETEKDVIFELEPTDSPKLSFREIKKLICNVNLEVLINDHEMNKDKILKNIVVAVIWKNDFNKNMDATNVSISENISTVLPYSLIKYQIPTIIHSTIPRLQNVAFCVHFIYKVHPQIKQWIDWHLEFGVHEIMIYDGVENSHLTKYLKDAYGKEKRIIVNPFAISFENLCNETILFKQFDGISIPHELKAYLRKSCKQIYDTGFLDKVKWRGQYEQLTVNDCFTVMKQKHEFIGYYDLDEYVFPRTIQNITSNKFSCKTFSSICSYNSFKPDNYKSGKADGNYLYNYLQSLIERNKHGQDIKMLGSIDFTHAAYLKPDILGKKLLNDLGSVIKKINEKNNSADSFPFSILLSEPPHQVGHTFVIENDDISHIKYLHKSYNNLIPCFYEKYLTNITKLDANNIRYLYYVTEKDERWGKAIHYYKNVKSLFVHFAKEFKKGYWSLNATALDGNFVAHFREDIAEVFSNAHTGSIKKLNIDYEYLMFLLKNYTLLCE